MPKKVITGFTWSLILLVGLGVWLRLVRLRELFHFTYDEEIIAFVGKRMWINGHIPLIGGVTPQHVHLAPYFYWFSGLILGSAASTVEKTISIARAMEKTMKFHQVL